VAFWIVVALALVGFALTALGIVALRDEPPRWMLRIKHPGRVLAAGLVVLVAAVVVNVVRYDINEEVADFVGHPVDCEKVGVLDIEGERRDVYACTAPQNRDTRIGCYAQVGETVVDVSSRVQAPGAFPAGKPDC
jgi:hypothetical protein